MTCFTRLAPALLALGLVACIGDEAYAPAPPPHASIHALAGGCFAVAATAPGRTGLRWLRPTASGEGFRMASGANGASRFFLKPADLGTFLLYDQEGRYLVAGEQPGLERRETLASDILTIDDTFISGAEWDVLPADAGTAPEVEQGVLHLRNRRTQRFLGADGELVDDASTAAAIALHAREGCAEHPELTLDAQGTVQRTHFDDGTLFGFVDTHSHLLTNFGFGGGGVFHGAPFHRLGVAHALPDCELFHGVEGRSDLLGFAFDRGTEGSLNVDVFLPALLSGQLSEFSHFTAGWPDFTTWPAAPFSSTHQTQYYRWLERAWLGGLRLVVQHATSNSIFCELIVGEGIQPVRYDCNDMVATDRSIEEAFNLERYVDAQLGGPGKGWFRIVKTPAEARAVIGEGKLAVLLGIEVSNLFDCFLAPRPGQPACDEAFLVGQLDRYQELGVRAVFPVHKYDNSFSPGDGHRTISEIGNFANTGHWSSYGLDCPEDVSSVFDHGDVFFGGLNKPREDFDAPPPNDMSGFPEDPVGTLIDFLDEIQGGSLEGDHCQTHGLSPLGELLIHELMKRGMIVEIDHLPRWSYKRAFEILSENGYPAAATHGSEYGGRIYENAGISKFNFGRCAEPGRRGAMADSLRERAARIAEAGGYPAPGFGFDLNGFAGGKGPRFGERSECDTPQVDPVDYPFTSYAGDVTFTRPSVGNRVLDFNTEGMVHVGLVAELIEDARRTGVTDEDLEPLFRSAEGYLRMWERAEERAAAMR
jgi:microsomal dipeptidase-like Zn-dependent dipeptidase